jgi:hypothetical protein
MNRPHFAAVRDELADPSDFSFDGCTLGGSTRNSLLGARIDTSWILRKFDTEFNDEIVQNLKKAVYAIGQGGRRWFSGGSELSGRQASTILDYLVLVELLLQYRNDLFDFRGDLFDCREQLLMQVSRIAEGQDDRVASLVESMVQSLQQQVAG